MSPCASLSAIPRSSRWPCCLAIPIMIIASACKNSNATVIPEPIVNLMGYERIAAGDNAGAIEVLALNVAQYPRSANVYDSLGDAYLAAGQKDDARVAAEKAIAALDTDPSLDDTRRQ